MSERKLTAKEKLTLFCIAVLAVIAAVGVVSIIRFFL